MKGLFELIAEARNVSPNLCTKGLRALFDVIQGQVPESFRPEPNDLIQPLYDLLLNLATLHGGLPNPQDSDLTNWSSIACSALLGLCVARGDTGKTIKAIAALIMSPKILSGQNIQVIFFFYLSIVIHFHIISYIKILPSKYHVWNIFRCQWFSPLCNGVFMLLLWVNQPNRTFSQMEYPGIR